METTVNLTKYADFVDTVTSDPSKFHEAYIQALDALRGTGCDIARLDTAATGLLSEAGEVMEIVKKLKFQGKEWTEDVRYHLQREAGDLIFYWINLCIALDIDWDDVVQMNVEKLKARYPGGVFSVHHSENRAPGDI